MIGIAIQREYLKVLLFKQIFFCLGHLTKTLQFQNLEQDYVVDLSVTTGETTSGTVMIFAAGKTDFLCETEEIWVLQDFLSPSF